MCNVGSPVMTLRAVKLHRLPMSVPLTRLFFRRSAMQASGFVLLRIQVVPHLALKRYDGIANTGHRIRFLQLLSALLIRTMVKSCFVIDPHHALRSQATDVIRIVVSATGITLVNIP